MKTFIFIVLPFLYSCKGDGQSSITKEKNINDSFTIVTSLKNVLPYDQLLIDTSLHFNNIKSLIKYKNSKDLIYYFNRANKKLSAFDIEKLEYDNSILSAYLLFKFFKGSDKNDVLNFNFLNTIINVSSI